MDPCHAPLSVIYSEAMNGGVVFRVRKRFRLRNGVTRENGYVAWYPSFHNGGADGTSSISGSAAAYRGGANLFVYNTTSPATSPVNSTTTPFGSGAAISDVEGRALADPAHDLVKSPNVSEARTLGACMRLIYTGTTSARQGEVFAISTLPQNALVRSDGSTLDVDDFISTAGHSCRTTNMEVIWRPDEESEYPRKGGQQASNSLASGNESVGVDAAFILGDPLGSHKTVARTGSLPGEPMGIGLAFTDQNLETSSDLYIELTKIVQVRYAPIHGTIESPPFVPSGVKPELSAHATQELDKKVGGSWSVRPIIDSATSLANKLADLTLGGSAMGSVSAALPELATSVAASALRGYLRRPSGMLQ